MTCSKERSSSLHGKKTPKNPQPFGPNCWSSGNEGDSLKSLVSTNFCVKSPLLHWLRGLGMELGCGGEWRECGHGVEVINYALFLYRSVISQLQEQFRNPNL